MNVRQAVELATTTLIEISESANLDARIIVCHACNMHQTTLITHPETELTQDQQHLFDASLERRSRGEPIAYITGRKEFWSLDLRVNEHVLIPRPETELLVELALSTISDIKNPRVLELGTGSGAIAIAIAKERPDSIVIATDVDAQALIVARDNAEKHALNIDFIQSNWFENIDKNKFNVIASNPPYISEHDHHLDQYVYQYEPKNALISGQNGLKDLTIITNKAKSYLLPSGTLIVEHGFQQSESVKNLFKENQYQNTLSHKDINEHFRCTSGCI